MMTPLERKKIVEIVDQLECGLKCYWNTKTNVLLFIPDIDDSYDEIEFWEQEFKQLENEADDFVEIEKPSSRDSFQMMENFIESDIPNAALKKQLVIVLERSKPFRNFKTIIDESSVREDWFAFRKEWMIKWVESEIEFLMENQNDD